VAGDRDGDAGLVVGRRWNIERQVDERAVTGGPDDDQHAARSQLLPHPCQRSRAVHVMKRGDGGDEIEPAGFQGEVEEVAAAIVNVRRIGVGASDADASLVPVDAGHAGHHAPELAGQPARAAANVKRSLTPCRERLPDDTVVVDVMVPRLGQGIGLRRGSSPVFIKARRGDLRAGQGRRTSSRALALAMARQRDVSATCTVAPVWIDCRIASMTATSARPSEIEHDGSAPSPTAFAQALKTSASES
jgi:hypothetical protein